MDVDVDAININGASDMELSPFHVTLHDRYIDRQMGVLRRVEAMSSKFVR